jgi:superfamily I DNA/RNA helicase
MFKAIWKVFAGWLGLIEEEKSAVVERPKAPASVPATPPRPTDAAPPAPVAKPIPVPRKLYEGNEFEIDDDDLAKAAKVLFADNRPHPTRAQQQVLFSDATATTVLAGAGSGKSTVLVQRVLFMHKVLKIDLTMMAVFTFTRKSRRDFIRKLLEEAPAWGVVMDEKQAERLVRTFHSKALSLARSILGKGERIFEFIGEEQPKKDTHSKDDETQEAEAELSEAEQLANELDGFIELEGNDDQGKILRGVYASCYNASANFRSSIFTLYSYTLASRPWPKDDPKFDAMIAKLEWMSSYDRALCQHVENTWKRQGHWPVNGITARVPDDKRFELRVMGEKFLSNGYIEALDLHVVLGPCDGVEQPSANLAKHKVKNPLASIALKRRALLVGADSKIRYVHTAEDLRKLKLQLATMESDSTLSSPGIMLRLPNESEKPAFESLYALGAFVETLGLQPDKISEILAAGVWGTIEHATIVCVTEFFKEFKAQLQAANIVTFNQIFSRLGEGSECLKDLSISALIGVKHLMIDEFQDISPLIVRFVRGVQGELLRKSGDKYRPTLMCVGDDWQSIYGWRGSSPHFLLNLPNHFPGAPKTSIQLEENFRSSQKIIDCGEAFIRHVQVKSNKRGIAFNPAVKHLPHIVGAIEEYTNTDVLETVREILRKAADDAKVYILAATHDDLDPFKALKDKRLMSTTFHQSKGLEADYVVLVGAPKHFGSNDLKNALYAAAKFPQRFDDAQRDEAFRVAYVAATRAKKLCLWFAEPSSGSVIEVVPANGEHRLQLESADVLGYVRQCLA